MQWVQALEIGRRRAPQLPRCPLLQEKAANKVPLPRKKLAYLVFSVRPLKAESRGFRFPRAWLPVQVLKFTKFIAALNRQMILHILSILLQKKSRPLLYFFV